VGNTIRVQVLGVQFRIPYEQWPDDKQEQIRYCRALLRRAGLDPALAREMQYKVRAYLK